MAIGSSEERWDVSAALLTMAAIGSSYKVESTKAMARMWKEFRTNVPVRDDADFVSIVLSMGRIMDMKTETMDSSKVMPVISAIKAKVSELGAGASTNADIGAAFLTYAITSHSEHVETTNSIMTLWNETRKKVPIRDDRDLAAAILATGRIMDMQVDVKDVGAVAEMVDAIKRELAAVDVQMDNRQMATLILAAAYVELSPKVEKFRDIVKSFVELKKNLTVADARDSVATILLAGKVRDTDTSMMIQPTSVAEQVRTIRAALETV